jgi:hypothetical protein
MVGLALDQKGDGGIDVQSYAKTNGFEFAVYQSPDDRTKDEYGLGSVPQTILIEHGKVAAVWRGEYTGTNAKEITARLRAKLPEEAILLCTDTTGMVFVPGAEVVVDGRRGQLSARCTVSGNLSFTKLQRGTTRGKS